MRMLKARVRVAMLAGGLTCVAAIVASCSTDGLMSVRPDVDVGVQTAAVEPSAPVADPAPALDMSETVEMSEPVAPVDQIEEPTVTVIDPAAGTAVEQAALAPVAIPVEPQSEPEPEPQTVVEPKPATVLAAYPRMSSPVDTPMRMSSDETSCRRELKRLGVKYRDLDPINDGGACRIDNPVLVSAIGGVHMKPAATLNCQMALTFARWTKKELVPAARWRFMSGVKTIHQGSSYSCRKIRRSGGVPSEHSRGNALDIMRIELNNGKDIDVRKPGWFSFRKRGFLNTVRADGCGYFNTVLGPGYDRDHADHFHFDIKQRRKGRVACH